MIATLFYIFITFTLGWLVTTYVFCINTYDFSFMQKLFLFGCIGPFYIYLFFIIQITIASTFNLFPIIIFIISASIIIVTLKGNIYNITKLHGIKLSKKMLPFYLTILLLMLLLLLKSFWHPITDVDDWDHFSGFSKYIYLHSGINDGFFYRNNEFLSVLEQSPRSYPLFVSANQILWVLLNGQYDDFGIKVTQVILFINFSMFMCFWSHYQQNRRLKVYNNIYLNIKIAMVFAIPFFQRSYAFNKGEIPMAIVLGLSVFLFGKSIQSPKRSSFFYLAVLFNSCLTTIKAEGAYVSIVLIVLYSTFIYFRTKKIELKKIIICLSAVLLVYGLWELVKHQYSFKVDRFSADLNILFILQKNTYLKFFEIFITVLLPSKYLSILGSFFFFAMIYHFLKSKTDLLGNYYILCFLGIYAIYAAGSFLVNFPSEIPRLMTHLVGLMLVFVFYQIERYILSNERLEQNL